MELVLKRPMGKPPCICMKFGSNYEAAKHNSILPNEYSKHPFALRFELGRNNKLDVTVVMEGYKIPYKYANVQFSPEKLNRFIEETRVAERYTFCHIVTVKNKDEVVYTPHKRILWVIKINSVELVNEY